VVKADGGGGGVRACGWGGPPMSVLELSVFSALANNKMFKITCSSSDVVS
jgi:hypothetical protein